MKITLLQKKKPPPGYIGNGDVNTAIIFIHGLFGSHYTWRRFSTHLEKNWDNIDSFRLQYDEYYENQGWFYTWPIIKYVGKLYSVIAGPGIDELSDHLHTVIEQNCKSFDYVILIAHSMGGLVARKYIINKLEADKDLGKVKALITYATPHNGSKWASKRLGIIMLAILAICKLNSKQIRQLGNRDNTFLKELNERWGSLAVDKKLDFMRVVGMRDWVVDTLSASFVNDRNVFKIGNKNHFTIVKPIRVDDPAYMVTYNYLRDFNSIMKAKLERIEEDI